MCRSSRTKRIMYKVLLSSLFFSIGAERSNGTKSKERVKCDITQFENDIIKHAVIGRNRDKYSSCAVVGSSGTLLGSGLGPEIDRHEFVIRMNDAPTFSYENDVGSKTNLMTISSGVISRWRSQADCKIDKAAVKSCTQRFSCPKYTVFLLAGIKSLKQWLRRKCRRIRPPTRKMSNLTKKILNARSYSTIIDIRQLINKDPLGKDMRSPITGNLMAGPAATLLALRICQYPIDLYGLSIGRDQTETVTHKYHYYDNHTFASFDDFPHAADGFDALVHKTFPSCFNVVKAKPKKTKLKLRNTTRAL